MENDKNRNYDRDETNYNTENRNNKSTGEQAQEFTNDQPNRFADQDRNINSPDIEEERKTDQNRQHDEEFDQSYKDDENRRNPLRRYQNL